MLKRGFQFAPGYRLQEFLGRGQFGQVWRATAPGGTSMAAKFIDLTDGQGQKEYEAIKRVKTIHHANLMPITAIWLLDGQGKVIEEAPDEAIETIDLSVQEDEGKSALFTSDVVPSWLVVGMLLGGKSLQQRLRECVEEGLPGIPPKELISYMDEAAKGLDFLNTPQHDLGEGPIAIQHCDVKPANIVLIGSSAVVCDFGLARILTRNQVTATSAAGTPAYMAPEAISGKPSRTSDQYSLAVTYYHLRTGTLPVNDGSLWEVLDAHRHGNLKLGLVPEAEQAVLRKATDLDWNNRFEWCTDMVDALREALRAEGHTKPSFFAGNQSNTQAGSPTQAVQGDATKAVQGDPTATIDLQSSDDAASDGAGLLETAPFQVGEQSTQKEGFVEETLPQLQDGSAAPTAAPTARPAWQQPRILAGIGAALFAVVVSAVVLNRDDHGGPPVVTQQDDSPNQDDQHQSDVIDEPELTAEALFAKANETYSQNPSEAVTLFRQAVAKDPGLLQPKQRELQAAHNGPIMWMLKTPRGKLITIAEDPTPAVWDLAQIDRKPVLLTGHQNTLFAWALRSAGDLLVTGGIDPAARVWNLSLDNPAESDLELLGHDDTINAALWHPKDPVVLTASDDKNLGIWKIDSPDQQHPHGRASLTKKPVNKLVRKIVTDPTGTWVIAKSEGENALEFKLEFLAYRWNELLQAQGSPTALPVKGASDANVFGFLKQSSPPHLVTGDLGGTISMFVPDADGFTEKTSKNGHQGGDIDAMAITAVDGNDVIVTGASDGSIHRWVYGTATSAGRRITVASDLVGVGCVDVSPDGRWIVAGTNDGAVWLWDSQAASGEGTYRLISGAASVDSVVIDQTNGWLIAGCSDSIVRLWDLTTVKLLALTNPMDPSQIEESPVEVTPPKFTSRQIPSVTPVSINAPCAFES